MSSLRTAPFLLTNQIHRSLLPSILSFLSSSQVSLPFRFILYLFIKKKTRCLLSFTSRPFLILVSATSYLPRRWPAKYFRRYESLRPCSGWVRVVSSRLATDDSLIIVPAYTQNCIMIIIFVISIFPTFYYCSLQYPFRKSPRPISISRLKMLPFLHL